MNYANISLSFSIIPAFLYTYFSYYPRFFCTAIFYHLHYNEAHKRRAFSYEYCILQINGTFVFKRKTPTHMVTKKGDRSHLNFRAGN